jgi:hypothetical protein
VDRPHALIGLLAIGCVPPEGAGEELATRATLVVDAPTAGEGPFADPELAVNGVRGEGPDAGGLDVFSLGLGVDEGLTLGFAEPVVPGEGPDLAVFENPFDIAGGGRFFDPVVVEVSADCEAFVAFPWSYAGGEWDADPAAWEGVAGLSPVLLHEEDNPVDPLSAEAGGDRFDVDDLGEEAPAEIACVRLTSASAYLDPSGEPFPHDPVANGPDIDGVYGR